MTENETKTWCNGQARNLTWSFVLTGSQMRTGIADSSAYTLWMLMAPVAIKMLTVFCFCLVFITTVLLLLSVKFGLPANDLVPVAGTAFGFLQRLIKENTIKACRDGSYCVEAEPPLGAGWQQVRIWRCHQGPGGSQKYSALVCTWDVECKLFRCKASGTNWWRATKLHPHKGTRPR